MKKIALAFTMLCLVAGALFAQSTSDLQVLAVVKYNKSESITVKQLKTRVAYYERQVSRNLSLDEKKKVLDSLIEEKLMLQAASKMGISMPDSYVDQYFLQSLSQQFGIAGNVTESELNTLVKENMGVSLDELLQSQTGMNVAEYKVYVKSQLVINQYIASVKSAELQRCIPTDEEIKMFYESNKASFVQSDMLKTFLLLVPKGNDPDAAKLKLNELKNKYQDKKITGEQLTAQANLPDSGYQAGDILVPKTEVYAASLGLKSYQELINLFAQKEGYITDIIETTSDFRFISVTKKYEAKMLQLMDLSQPETNITVYDYIRSYLGQQKQFQFIQVASAEMAAEINTADNVERKKTGDALDKLLSWGE